MARVIGNVSYEELFTCKWTPLRSEPKALILCHGYAMECSISMNDTGTRLARDGFAVYGIDYEGHGKSAGLEGLINSVDTIVVDCADFFSKVSEKSENRRKMRFLLGESLGGAIAILLSWRKPDYFDGAILVAPMCKLADEMRPSGLVISVVTQLCKVIPTWKLVPSQDIVEIACRVPEKRDEVRANPYCYKGRPRLKTGQELLKITLLIEQKLSEKMEKLLDELSSWALPTYDPLTRVLNQVTIPFIVLHGGSDKVTDISVSKLLHERATSSDKTFKMYPDMWHALTYGETPENTDIVFEDIVDWIDTRAAYGNSRLEREQKLGNDASTYTKKGTSGLVEALVNVQLSQWSILLL